MVGDIVSIGKTVVEVDSDTVGIGDVAAALGELVGTDVVMLDSVGVVDTLCELVGMGVVEVDPEVVRVGVTEAVWELAVDGVGVKLCSLDNDALCVLEPLETVVGVAMLVCVSDNVVIIDTL